MAVRRMVWRTRFLVDSLLGNAKTSKDQMEASSRRGEPHILAKFLPVGKGEPKEQPLAHVAGVLGVPDTDAAWAFTRTPPKTFRRGSERSATPKAPFAA